MKIAFLGAGQMAEALIAKLGREWRVIAADKDAKRLAYIKSAYQVTTAADNAEAFALGEVVVLAVKPQNIAEVLQGIKGKKLVISIAAGIPLRYLQKKLPGAKVIRAMPNNPALVGYGMTALAKGKGTGNRELGIAKSLFATVGEVVTVPEKWLDAVTGLSGSGPAYVYQMIEAMAAGGVKLGLPKKLAAQLAVQTVLGAAATVKQTGQEPAALRVMVTSPGGTTLEGLKVLARRQFSRAVAEAVAAAAKKAELLSKKWAT